MKKWLYGSIALLITGALLWLFSGDFFHSILSYVENSDLLTLETRFTPEEIMEVHQKELVGTSQRSFKEPSIYFYPYLLLDVKYFDKNHKSRQGTILWSLVDGEMVLNSETWQKTQGFEDAIRAKATEKEFKVLNTLADQNGQISKERLQKLLGVESDPFNRLIESLKQKQLIVLKGNQVILHFEDPLFHVPPQTLLANELVIKPYHQGKKIPPKYTRKQIEKVAHAAFGAEFTIRSIKEIFLPIIRISVLNPDGTLLLTDWNALTGEKIEKMGFL